MTAGHICRLQQWPSAAVASLVSVAGYVGRGLFLFPGRVMYALKLATPERTDRSGVLPFGWWSARHVQCTHPYLMRCCAVAAWISQHLWYSLVRRRGRRAAVRACVWKAKAETKCVAWLQVTCIDVFARYIEAIPNAVVLLSSGCGMHRPCVQLCAADLVASSIFAAEALAAAHIETL